MLISIILEWENAVLAELDRTSKLLIQVFSQTSAQEEQFELLILHNEKQVAVDFIKGFVTDIINEQGFQDVVPFSVIDVQAAHYFQLKNEGVRLAKGETIIFLDSDIIPQEGWLKLILDAHQQHPDSLISGYSFIDFSDLIGKAFALCWFFPLPPVSSKMLEVDLIFSNNYIVSRQLMLDNPYPQMKEGVTRGSDNILWKRLKLKGVRLCSHSGARATHPCPNGWGHFFKRALAEGRDDYMRMFEKEYFEEKPFTKFFKIYLYRWKKVFKSTFKNGHRVNLRPYEVPLVLVIMTVYYKFYFFGGMTTKFFPKYSQVAWRI